MKNNKVLNISIFTSILLFSACSNSQDQIKPKNVSIYNIMGITQSKKSQENVSTDINYISYKKNDYTENISPDITYISYKKNNYTEKISPDISYISYKKNDYVNHHKLQIIQDIEDKAKSFLGVPYVWGATGPSKFDCSGFTQWVYRDSGINIPRVSKDQARVGEFIKYENLQRGDMVFFDTKKKRTGRVSHVGIYLGNNNFIHASSAGKSVVIYNFNEKTFYKKRFLWGRRVLKPDFYYALN